MPKAQSDIERDCRLLTRWFDDLGNSIVLPKEVLQMVNNAFVLGQLSKELEIIEGRKLFDGEENNRRTKG